MPRVTASETALRRTSYNPGIPRVSEASAMSTAEYPKNEGFTVILSTIDDKRKAEEIAERLVGEKLAACINVVGPINSVYWWQGKVEKAEEYLMIIKTTKELRTELMKRLKELHTYQVPEIISIDITDGYKDYLNWILESVKK